jgi:hypothetical protein
MLCIVFQGVLSGAAGAGTLIKRLPSEWAVVQLTPDAEVLADMARSETIVDVESQAITPALPLKVTPEKSTLELTSAKMAGPLFWEMPTPRSSASELPSTRMAALSGSPVVPLLRI